MEAAVGAFFLFPVAGLRLRGLPDIRQLVGRRVNTVRQSDICLTRPHHHYDPSCLHQQQQTLSNGFTVNVIQLQNQTGTPYNIGGIGTEDEEVHISDAVPDSDRTVTHLKPLIIQQFFPDEQKSESRIIIYLFPNAPSAAASTGGSGRQNRTAPLQENGHYGFIDLAGLAYQPPEPPPPPPMDQRQAVASTSRTYLRRMESRP